MLSTRPPAYEADDQQASTSSSEAVDYDPSLQNQLDRIFGCDLPANDWNSLDASQSLPSRQLQLSLAEVQMPPCGKRVSNAPDSVAAKRPKAKKQLKEISLEQFRNYVLNLDALWDENAKNFNCPACERILNLAKRKSIRHLLEHLHDPAVHPYKCPVDDDCFTSVRGDAVQSHVKAVHKLEWTETLRHASVHTANKAVIDSIVSQI
ncbi:hypothetical protein AAVH_33436 [Aphelenchoides avenae]|nr:hypothetical protein AAVH_33436 [Aphelenchus avenae]